MKDLEKMASELTAKIECGSGGNIILDALREVRKSALMEAAEVAGNWQRMDGGVINKRDIERAIIKLAEEKT